MKKRKDITRRKDIELLVDAFYEKIRSDALIGPIFTDVAHVNWERHLPVMYDFWENLLFHTGNYSGNPMSVHLRIHRQHPLTSEDFRRWLEIFTETLTDHFEGERTEMARERAASIGTVMELKLRQDREEGTEKPE